MRSIVRLILPFLLCSVALSARGEEPLSTLPEGHERELRYRMPAVMTPEERAAWHEERRARREQWRQMSPEERHQLRRDIREAGHELYRQPRRRSD